MIYIMVVACGYTHVIGRGDSVVGVGVMVARMRHRVVRCPVGYGWQCRLYWRCSLYASLSGFVGILRRCDLSLPCTSSGTGVPY